MFLLEYKLVVIHNRSQAAGKTREPVSIRMIKIFLVKFVGIPKTEKVAYSVTLLSVDHLIELLNVSGT